MNWHKGLQNIPKIIKRRMAVHVTRPAESAIRAGHPWLFEDSITNMSFDGQPGTLVVVFDHHDKFLAVGLYDPNSVIRVRILQCCQPTRIDSEWFYETLNTAWRVREPIRQHETNGYRLIHGENDGLPGFIVDQYAEILVVKLYSEIWFPYLQILLNHLLELSSATCIVLRLSRLVSSRDTFGLQDGLTIYGEVPSDDVIFWENGLRFAADVVRGHKTGFFFDQRENRQRVGNLSARAENVLDVFAYSGGFSLYAAQGGARHVISVDSSDPALKSAQRNFLLNADNPNVAKSHHEVLVGDAFNVMEQFIQDGRLFDIVIIDPPSFAKQASEVEGALQAYSRLARLGELLVSPNGYLVMASCSSRVKENEFFSAVESVITRNWTTLQRYGHAVDHPIGFPEGAYLKCVFVQLN